MYKNITNSMRQKVYMLPILSFIMEKVNTISLFCFHFST